MALYFHCAEFSALPETDGAARSLYHYIALGPGGVQDRQFYRDINDTEAEHLPEDIVAHLRERREDTAVAVDRSAATKYLKIFDISHKILLFPEITNRVLQSVGAY